MGGSWGVLRGAGGVLGLSWRVLGGVLGVSWALQQAPGAILGRLGGLSRRSWGSRRVLGRSWSDLGGILEGLWGDPGGSRGDLGPIRGDLRRILKGLKRPGPILERSEGASGPRSRRGRAGSEGIAPGAGRSGRGSGARRGRGVVLPPESGGVSSGMRRPHGARFLPRASESEILYSLLISRREWSGILVCPLLPRR